MASGTSVHIRTFEPSDGRAVEALWAIAFPSPPPWNVPAEDIARKRRVQPELFVVAEAGDRLVGTAMGGYDGHRGWVYYVAVAPDRRREGIATHLMREVESRLVGMGCPKLNLMIRAENAHVVAFYEALGYRVEDRVIMSRRLETTEGSRTGGPGG
jgi:ribosomal protein S18 acetylase RimI-like enzyme